MKKLVQGDMVTELKYMMSVRKLVSANHVQEENCITPSSQSMDARRNESALGLVHSDVYGKMSIQSLGGCHPANDKS